MQIGLGLDESLRLSWPAQRALAKEAAQLGYTSLWTNETTGLDSFHVCAQRWAGSAEAVPGGITTGIAVSPVSYRTPIGFAQEAGTVGQLTGGKFILGIGSGGAHRPGVRESMGLPPVGAISLMRAYLKTTRGLLAGESVTHSGPAVTLKDARLTISPAPKTPVYLATLGPQMLKLAGAAADGACLNWCTAEQVAWSRERIAEGAKAAGRDPHAVPLVEYIRICVDDDIPAARRALAKAMAGYALGGPNPTPEERRQGYRGHFERMGFTEDLLKLDKLRAQNVSPDQLADAFPEAMLTRIGYYGPAKGAAAAFKRIAASLDVAIVRVVVARPGEAEIRACIQACAPGKS